VSHSELRFTIRRILVPVDASSGSMATIARAVDLAGKLEAELLALFVEDIELLRLADSPYARELVYFSAAETPLSREIMESKLKAQSERARKALEAAGEHAQVRWSFRTVRGDVLTEILAAANQVDLLAIDKMGCFRQRFRIGPAVLQMATSAIPLLILPERGVAPSTRVLLHYDGTPAAQQRLLAAVELVRLGASGVTVLLPANEPERILALRKEAGAMLDGKKIDVRYRQIDPRDQRSLRRALQSESAGVLILGRSEMLRALQGVEDLLHETQTALLLLGDGAEPDAE
jgi:nucleotide-binding universal stress UspA family protein